MSIYVFLGPSLSVEEAREHLDAVYLPPVSQGDVARVARSRPQAIGIVDGVFERVPAVWHKEILAALAQGTPVFGAASMGALRAAELDAFGMNGVGWVFEAYRDGLLEDDDEVAVAHGPASAGYRCVSDAMVNIRRTLARAEDEGIVGARTASRIEQLAKGTFYPERKLRLAMRQAREDASTAAEIDALAAWLPSGYVDQKKCDAIAMLRALAAFAEGRLTPKSVAFHFEPTEWWSRAERDVAHSATEAPGAATGEGRRDDHGPSLEAVLDELRLEGEATYGAARDRGLLRFLALAEGRQRRVVLDADALGQASRAFREERGLLAPDDLAAWCEANGMNREAFLRLVIEEGVLAGVRRALDESVQRNLPSTLRADGRFAALEERARQKRRALGELALETATLASLRVSEEALLQWYFEDRLGESVPADLAAYARRAGFREVDAMVRALVRERCFVDGMAAEEDPARATA